jgi:Tol biopolymer transport system component
VNQEEAHVIRKLGFLTTLTVAMMVAAGNTAWATFPGHNGRIAYSNGPYQIASMNPDGSGKHQLTHLSGSFAEAPQYSADGNWIVFDADTGSSVDIFTMKSDGTHVRNLTRDGTNQWSPSWSPSGDLIVYAVAGGGSPIWTIRADGTHAHALGSAVGEFPRYSPSGKKIAYGADDGLIHVMNADGTHDHPVSPFGQSADYPDWSPDGSLIIYTSNESGQSEVWMMHADGSHNHQVTTTGAAYGPVFSPDGRRIAFNDGSGFIDSAKLDGSNQHELGGTGGCCIGWQPLP